MQRLVTWLHREEGASGRKPDDVDPFVLDGWRLDEVNDMPKQVPYSRVHMRVYVSILSTRVSTA
jgi:hypothetical protein